MLLVDLLHSSDLGLSRVTLLFVMKHGPVSYASSMFYGLSLFRSSWLPNPFKPHHEWAFASRDPALWANRISLNSESASQILQYYLRAPTFGFY